MSAPPSMTTFMSSPVAGSLMVAVRGSASSLLTPTIDLPLPWHFPPQWALPLSLSKLERRAFTQHRLGLVRVPAASLMQHEAGKEAKAGAASLFRLHNDAARRLAFFREEWEQANCAETPVEQRQQLGQSLRHMDQGDPTLWRGEGGEETDPGIKRSLLHDVRSRAAFIRRRPDCAFSMKGRIGNHLAVALSDEAVCDERFRRSGQVSGNRAEIRGKPVPRGIGLCQRAKLLIDIDRGHVNLTRAGKQAKPRHPDP